VLLHIKLHSVEYMFYTATSYFRITVVQYHKKYMIARNIQSDLRRILVFTSPSYAGMRKLSLRYNPGLRESRKSFRPLGSQCYIWVEYLPVTSHFIYLYLIFSRSYYIYRLIYIDPILKKNLHNSKFTNLDLKCNRYADIIMLRMKCFFNNIWSYICQ